MSATPLDDELIDAHVANQPGGACEILNRAAHDVFEIHRNVSPAWLLPLEGCCCCCQPPNSTENADFAASENNGGE